MFARLARLGLLWLALLPAVTLAADAVPQLRRHVTDLTGTLSAADTDAIDAQLLALEKRKGAQLVVLMVGTTAPQDLEGYSLAVAEANKVGRKGPDDGALLLIAKDDRRVRIEVGYGLEGAIPDVTAARIIREYLSPKLRTGDYAGGIRDAVGAMTTIIDGEALPPPVEPDRDPQRQGGGLGHGLMVALVVAFVARSLFGRTKWWLRMPAGGLVTGAVAALLATSLGAGLIGLVIGGVVGVLPFGGGRSIGGGGWGGFGGGGFGGGGFGGGGGGFGGGGGGGFSGGGGSFGGGGASGSW